eukprot:TRINITY_DN4213_c0_g1_i5.p1 TRINITY_DN4213_c0_g1~~TRINITY_DN4213_c0_g1_i5.p1  ORF type:complete len:476 (-),score=37.35 TRINITY_DN4213_c0_g1_i5:2311-3738(-)
MVGIVGDCIPAYYDQVKGSCCYHPQSEKFEDDYKVTRKLGGGAQAEVFECIHRYSKQVQAVKVFRQRSSDGRREAKYLRKLQSHPNIIGYKQQYEQEDSFSLVMECGLMDLLEYALHHSVVPWDGRSPFPQLREGQIAHLARGMAKAVQHCHQLGILHRDIKTTNFAMGADGYVKLIDFGFAFSIKQGKFPKACIGTTEFWAPEVAEKDVLYGTEADVYALGVTIYHLITGRLPDLGKQANKKGFQSTSVEQMFDTYRHKFKNLPSQAVDLLQKMLRTDPGNRITIDEVVQHPWMNENENEGLRQYIWHLQNSAKQNYLPQLHGLHPKNPTQKAPTFRQNKQQNHLSQVTSGLIKNDTANIREGYHPQIKGAYAGYLRARNNNNMAAIDKRQSSLRKVGKIAKQWWARLGCKVEVIDHKKERESLYLKQQQRGYLQVSVVDRNNVREIDQRQFQAKKCQGELSNLLPPIMRGRKF